MHEIVTIQLGSQSNYVGTHFWNAQESYFTYAGEQESPVDHNVHFREGVGAGGVDTFTPRTLIYDFKSNFGSLRRMNELYEGEDVQPSQSDVWGGSTAPYREPPIEKSAYQQSLDAGVDSSEISNSSVRFWSDFNRVFYHPRSIIQVYDSELDPGQRAFSGWSSGEELFVATNREEDLIDRDVRALVEECDQMQGLQILTSVDNGWSGFASKYLNQLRDDLGKLPIIVSGLSEPSNDAMGVRGPRLVNQARSLLELSEHATIYAPLTALPRELPSYINTDLSHPWHVSALQAIGLESILLPTKLKPSERWDSASLDRLTALVNGDSDRRIAQLSFEIGETTSPEQHTNGDSRDHGEVDDNKALDENICQLFPETETQASNDGNMSHVFAVLEVDRGEDFGRMQQANRERRVGAEEAALLRLSSTLPMPLPNSFPRILSVRRRDATSIAVRASLSVSSSIGTWIKSLEETTRSRVPFDEREEFLNGLRSVREVYEWGYERIDDDDDDSSMDG